MFGIQETIPLNHARVHSISLIWELRRRHSDHKPASPAYQSRTPPTTHFTSGAGSLRVLRGLVWRSLMVIPTLLLCRNACSQAAARHIAVSESTRPDLAT